MGKPVSIGILGEYNPNFKYHMITQEALAHSAKSLDLEIEPVWVSTRFLAQDPTVLDPFDGVFCAPSDYKSIDGVLAGIEFCREQPKPFLAT